MPLSILLFAFLAGLFQATAQPMEQATLKSYIENGAPFEFILVDVRGAEEIKRAIGNENCKPYNLAWPDGFRDISATVPKDRVIIIYCQSGRRAGRAANFLTASGYTIVHNAGGIGTWEGPTIPPSEIKPASLLPEPSMRATR